MAQRYLALAERHQALGDRPGAVIATSFALGAENFGGDLAAALSAYERLATEISDLEDPLERHMAMGCSLLLYHAAARPVPYMQHACRMLQLAEEVGHSGLQLPRTATSGLPSS